MNKQLKVGDIIERCNFMPAIIQAINGDIIKTFDYSHVSFPKYNGRSLCSIKECNIRKISYKFALKLIALGIEKVTIIYQQSDSLKKYDRLVSEEYDKILKGEL